jgi:hypothetical protein
MFAVPNFISNDKQDFFHRQVDRQQQPDYILSQITRLNSFE